jgi:magnesium chelatase accessory protein
MAPSDQLQWAVDGLDWPGREHSRFVRTPQVRWHVQVSGAGPVVLLLHGTGAASHSWRDVAPLLARHFTVVVPDLPGHGFTQTDSLGCLSLPGMTRACAQLLTTLGLEPAMVVGHSAAAAVAARACLDGYWQPRQLVSLCGALLPLQGLAGHLMPPAARLLAVTGLASRLVCRPAGRPGAVERLIQSTGSQIDERGVALYRRLVSSPAHVQGVVRMRDGGDHRF